MPAAEDERVEEGRDGILRCVSCGQPVDDIQTMGEKELLETIHLGALRELARTLRSGNATHQELAVARGLLRDNKKTVDPADGEEEDPHLPPQSPPRAFPSYAQEE